MTSALISSIMKRDTKKIANVKFKPSQQLFIPHFQRALAHERLKQIDKAIDDYSLCLRIDSNHAQSYFNRGGMYKVVIMLLMMMMIIKMIMLVMISLMNTMQISLFDAVADGINVVADDGDDDNPPGSKMLLI
jgi:tetratricopeptide (TPR) repeat protein